MIRKDLLDFQRSKLINTIQPVPALLFLGQPVVGPDDEMALHETQSGFGILHLHNAVAGVEFSTGCYAWWRGGAVFGWSLLMLMALRDLDSVGFACGSSLHPDLRSRPRRLQYWRLQCRWETQRQCLQTLGIGAAAAAVSHL